MAWQALQTSLIPAEPSPGDGNFSDWIALKPGEKIDLHVERTDDAGAGEDYTTEIFGSPDKGVHDSDIASNAHRDLATVKKRELVIAGPFSIRVRMRNSDSTPVDAVSGTVTYRIGSV